MTTTAPRDYDEILGIARNADAQTLKEAFHELALRYHPDRNKEPGSAARRKEMAVAYAILSDPEKRTRYDAGGAAGVAGISPEDRFSGIDFGGILGGRGFDFDQDWRPSFPEWDRSRFGFPKQILAES